MIQWYNDTTMQQCDDATMRRCNDATMQRYDNMTIWRYDNMTIWQYDNMTMRQCDNATMRRYNDATMTRRRNKKTWQYDNNTTTQNTLIQRIQRHDSPLHLMMQRPKNSTPHFTRSTALVPNTSYLMSEIKQHRMHTAFTPKPTSCRAKHTFFTSNNTLQGILQEGTGSGNCHCGQHHQWYSQILVSLKRCSTFFSVILFQLRLFMCQ